MKYRQLTKEQLEELHKEFALFLASQSIDINEWNSIKKDKPEVAEEALNIFSDMVWDDVLTKAKFVEHFSKTSINLFECKNEKINRIYIKVNWDINLLEEEGFKWLMSNPLDNSVEIFKGSKTYSTKRNLEIFKLIEQGGALSKGEIFKYFKNLIS